MKRTIQAALAAAVLSIPLFASAQTSDGLTRAQVRAELVQLAQVGYHPSRGNNLYYPADVEAAVARLQATRPAAASGFGSGADGSSQAGSRIAASATGRSIYAGH
jgi:hypothetical protein